MRNLIIALLALNSFYFIWVFILGNARYAPTPPSKTERGIPSLILLPATNSDVYQRKNSNSHSNCYTFGPFSSEKTTREVAKKINDYGLATAIRKQKTKQTLNFMVYLQALASRKEAEGVVKDIRKHKIKEFTIIETGPYKNAIALGAFNNLDKARRHAEYVRFLGYDAKYTVQKKQKEVFWIDYDELKSSNAPVFLWVKQIDPGASAEKIPKACDF